MHQLQKHSSFEGQVVWKSIKIYKNSVDRGIFCKYEEILQIASERPSTNGSVTLNRNLAVKKWVSGWD